MPESGRPSFRNESFAAVAIAAWSVGVHIFARISQTDGYLTELVIA